MRSTWKLLGVLYALGALGAGLGVRDPEKRVPQDPRSFQHADHVPRAWLSGNEAARDCRGCHAYAAPPHDPQAVCSNCHGAATSTFEVQTTPRYERDLAPLRESRSPFFEHTDHLNLACGECHGPERGQAPLVSVPDPMPIRRGLAECARCHGPEAGSDFTTVPWGRDLDPDRQRAGFLTKLNASPRMTPDELGPFLHEVHLPNAATPFTLEQLTAAGQAQQSCAQCHGGVLASNAENLGLQKVDFTSCATCHRDAAAALVFRVENRPSPSASALTFAHEDHLRLDQRDERISAAPGYERIETEGCSACHGYAPSGPDSPEWSFQVSETQLEASVYAGCVTCHDLPEWRTQDHGNWNTCQTCHTFGTGEMKRNRPTAEVRRSPSTPFRIETQTHPFISIGQGELLEDCRKCHRAPVGALPSRLQERGFSHATHLPEEPTQLDCDRCHGPDVNASSTSAALGWFPDPDPAREPEPSRTYDPSACAGCHRGGAVVALEPPTPVQPRTVVEFSHEQHLGKTTADGRQVSCLLCHEPQGTANLGTLPDAVSCTLCHDHLDSGPLWQNTGGINGTDVTSCALCHEAGVPEIRVQVSVAHQAIDGIGGTQFHPADQDCFSCHLQQDTDLYRVPEDHVFAVGGFLPGTRRSDRHPPGAPRPANCVGCHWSLQPSGSPDPQQPALRSRLGDDLRRFPGQNASR